jgi:hypothetical protein
MLKMGLFVKLSFTEFFIIIFLMGALFLQGGVYWVRLGVEMGEIWKNVELFARIMGYGGSGSHLCPIGGSGSGGV